jgi:protein-S-isoprenylcysteine O-methyltransferase Ste14
VHQVCGQHDFLQEDQASATVTITITHLGRIAAFYPYSRNGGPVSLKAIAFRLRGWIFASLYLLGFLAPWQGLLPGGRTGSLWLAASTLLARTGWIGLAASTLLITLTALFFCAAGAALRVWAAVCLGSSAMEDSGLDGRRMGNRMGEPMVAAGPYRSLRNPPYLGTLLFSLGVSFLMPVTGALFFLLGIYFLQRLLISFNETALSAKPGETDRDSLRPVPPLASPNPISSARPHWVEAAFAEIFPLGFALCFAVFAWRYNRVILIKCLVVCYGLSLIVRALSPSARPSEKS